MSSPINAVGFRLATQQLGISQGGGAGGINDTRGKVLDAGITEGPSFGDTLKNALGKVSEAQENASDYVQKYLRGEPVELHQVMAATEEAGLSLEMLVEIRNKLTEAYRSVISMQS